MTCKNCGAELREGTRFCGNCGAVIEIAKEPEETRDFEIEIYDEEPKVEIEEPTPVVEEPVRVVNTDEPVGIWKFFGLLVLYGIPVVGLIFILLFSFGITENKNIKNFSRAIFLLRILVTIISVAAAFFISGFAEDTIVNLIKMF